MKITTLRKEPTPASVNFTKSLMESLNFVRLTDETKCLPKLHEIVVDGTVDWKIELLSNVTSYDLAYALKIHVNLYIFTADPRIPIIVIIAILYSLNFSTVFVFFLSISFVSR